MMEERREFLANMIRQLKRERDELLLKIHLGKQDLKDELSKLQDKLAALNRQFEPLKGAVGETADDVWESLKAVGGEIREGFDRIRKSL